MKRAELLHALEESVKLQSHYASTLNSYDGGERLQFKDVQAWLDRLKSIKIQCPECGEVGHSAADCDMEG